MEELMKTFGELVEQYSRHQLYIERATSESSKFSQEIIEKVVLDHSVKSAAVAEKILPHVPELQSNIARIEVERGEIQDEKASCEHAVQELELRLAISELDEKDFKKESADYQKKVKEADKRIEALGAELDVLSVALQRWVDLAQGADQDPGLDQQETDGATEGSPDAVDVDSSIEEEGEESPIPQESQEEMVDEGDDADVEDLVVDEEFAMEDLEPEVDEEESDGLSEVENEEAGGDKDVDESDDQSGTDGDQRQALLLYSEGTAEEQIYPFTKDELAIGRGPKSDIQIKNDNKVSRGHCRLYRKTGNFYIEDLKSSNGTTVNGELITERRLFGGEEIVVGETFFRFRIM